MKVYFLFVLGVLFAMFETRAAFSAEDIPSQVGGELKSLYDSAQMDLGRAMKRVEELKGQKEKALSDAQKQKKTDEEGINLLTSYTVVIGNRYVNEKSEFEPGMLASTKDQEIMNHIFERYLHIVPFRGKTSAGEAVRTLTWGISRLGELLKQHRSPSETNNADLEMIAYQNQINQVVLAKAQTRIQDLVAKMGNAITETSTAEVQTPAPNRSPASKK